jgi:hypothetical protein
MYVSLTVCQRSHSNLKFWSSAQLVQLKISLCVGYHNSAAMADWSDKEDPRSDYIPLKEYRDPKIHCLQLPAPSHHM